MDELSPEFDECPRSCANGDETRRGFCESCPKGELKEAFEADCIEYLDDECGDSWKRYGFENLYASVLDVRDIEDSGIEMTKKTAELVRIMQRERNKMERIDLWQRRQELNRMTNREK